MRPITGIASIEPLTRLAPGVAKTLLVGGTDARVRRHAVLGFSQPGPDTIAETAEPFVGGVHTARQAVPDELDGASVVGDLDEALALVDVHGVDLHPICPVGDAQLKSVGRDGIGEVDVRGVAGDEEVGRPGGDVGEGPVQA